MTVLVLLLAMEAIILATLILMTQNRQQRLAERRAHLDLQINLTGQTLPAASYSGILTLQARAI